MSVDISFKPWSGLSRVIAVIHLLSLTVVLGLTYDRWWVALLLAFILIANLLFSLYFAGQKSTWQLVLTPGKGWRLELPCGVSRPVICRFQFVSPLLVAVGVRSRDRAMTCTLILTSQSCSFDHWRQLHIVATMARSHSGMTDDDVLGSKINGNKNGVLGHF